MFYIARDLPQELTALTSFAIGQIYFRQRKYDQSQIYLEKAIAHLPENKEAEKEELLLQLALTRVAGFNDFEYGIEVTSRVIESNPHNAHAYLL